MLRTKEAAKELNVQPSTLEAWRCRGGGPQFVKLGKAVRYRIEDLEAFKLANVRNNTSQRF